MGLNRKNRSSGTASEIRIQDYWTETEQGGSRASGGNQRPVSTDFNNELCDTALCVDEVHRQHARHDEEVAYERDGEVAEEKEPTFSVSSKNLSFP